ncbi:MAG TPA: DUF1192 domain-containing protein [Hellea balneolensis]|uniref:DUF1192 domain-containing protein n=1 Tax=Hellea balneolensis TaxID=287478 RepID=A0A7C5R538_9PROT|nr:DUF1192 domain-containing protein [Hellea balneolensis]
MEDLEIREAGLDFRVGEDLYGVSIAQLQQRLQILNAEIARIKRALDAKQAEISTAESFFNKS